MPFVLISLSAYISSLTNVIQGSTIFYLPVATGLVLIYWWGPRVLPSMYLNAMMFCGYYDLGIPIYYPLYALPETIFVFLSWFFFMKLLGGKPWFPDNRSVLQFLGFGLFIPLIVHNFLLEYLFVATGEVSPDQFWNLFTLNYLGDFLSIFGLSLPILYFFTGHMGKRGLAFSFDAADSRLLRLQTKFKSQKNIFEVSIGVLGVIAAFSYLEFADYWFLYGILSLAVAMRFGFIITILFNSFILILTYLLPSLLDFENLSQVILSNEGPKLQIGYLILFVFSTIAARVLSDATSLEMKLIQNNHELSQTNRELDKFVYSVSHDLSAPLKSIKGLVAISRLEDDPEKKMRFISTILKSVLINSRTSSRKFLTIRAMSDRPLLLKQSTS